MSKPEWGAKRVCQSCGTKFYDLLRSPIVCPRCGEEFDVEPVLRGRRTRPVAAKAAAGKPDARKPDAGKPDKEPVPIEETEDQEDDEDDQESEDVEDDDGKEDAETADEDLETDPVDGDENGPIEDASELGEDDGMSKVAAGTSDDGETET